MQIEGDNIVQHLGMQVERFVQAGIGIDSLAHHVFLTSTLEYPFYRATMDNARAHKVYPSSPRKTGALLPQGAAERSLSSPRVTPPCPGCLRPGPARTLAEPARAGMPPAGTPGAG